MLEAIIVGYVVGIFFLLALDAIYCDMLRCKLRLSLSLLASLFWPLAIIFMVLAISYTTRHLPSAKKVLLNRFN